MKVLKDRIIKNYNFLLKKGMNLGSEGNISIKYNEKVFITPSGIDIKKLKTENISEIDFNGNVTNGVKPSSELDLHLLIYKKRKDVNSIVHCHSDWASILSCMRQKIKKFHYMIAEFGGDDIKCSKYATFGTTKLANLVLAACRNRKGCLIANHGQISLGHDIDEAVHLSLALEKLAKQYYFCLLSKNFKLLNSNEISDVLKKFTHYKSKH